MEKLKSSTKGSGDQKFTPTITQESLKKLGSVSAAASQLHADIATPMLAPRPSSLGFPSDVAQSSYYPGDLRVSSDEISRVSRWEDRI